MLDSLVLDQKRRIVWVRHGSNGYLILLGQNQDVLLQGPVVLTKEIEAKEIEAGS
jgi:hypothetical protein